MFKMRRTTLLLLCTAFAMSYTASSQSWQWAKRMGGVVNKTAQQSERVIDISTDRNGNVYLITHVQDTLLDVGGQTQKGWGGQDALLASYTCEGIFRWSKLIGSAADSDFVTSVRCDSTNGVYVYGASDMRAIKGGTHFGNDTMVSNTNRTLYLAKWDTAGRYQWLRLPQPDTLSRYAASVWQVPTAMDVDGAGNAYLLAHLTPGLYGGGYNAAARSLHVLKYSAAGQFLSGTAIPISTQRDNPAEFSSALNKRLFIYDASASRFLMYVIGRYYNTGTLSYTMLGTKVLSVGESYIIGFNTVTGAQGGIIASAGISPKSVNIYQLSLDGSNNIILGGSATDSAQFNGIAFYNSKHFKTPMPVIMKLDGATGAVKWVTYGQTSLNSFSNIGGLSVRNGKVVAGISFHDTISFPGASLTNVYATDTQDIAVLQLDAATGKVQQFAKAGGVGSDAVISTAADRKGNFYIGGNFGGPSITIGGTTLLNNRAANEYSEDAFIAKWGVASCNCTVPTPAFTGSGAVGASRRFTYTGTTTGIDSLVWSWGDGQSQKVTTGFTTIISHSYTPATATYEVCVTAYSSACGSNQVCTQSVPLGISAASGSAVSVYPNPARDELSIAGAEGGHYTLRSITGSALLSGEVNSGRHVIDLRQLSPGIYLLNLRDAKGGSATLRITKE